MKTNIIKIFCFFFLLVSLPACSPDLVYESDPVGKATAIKNGKKWEALVFNFSNITDDTIPIYINKFSGEGFLRNRLDFYNIPFEVGTVELQFLPIDTINYLPNTTISATKYATSLDDGHVTGNIFRLIEGYPCNRFEITEINEKRRRVKGEFELAFEFDDRVFPDRRDFSEPDTIIFTEGKFSFKMEK